MNTAIATRPASLLMDVEAFNHMQRVGKMLALSPLFPEHLRKGGEATAIANGVLVMNMAARLQEDPLTVAQNIYFVGGKPGWSASYMIGKANQNGVFRDTIDWEVEGEGNTLSVTAFGVLASTGKRVSVTCDMAMAKAEGWTKNTKYQSMPQQMLRYRSATALIRLYCPEVMIGMPATIELETGMRDITPEDEPKVAKPRKSAAVEAVAEDVVEAEEAEQHAEPETEKPRREQKAEDSTKPAQADEPADESDKPTEVDFAGNRWGQSFLTDVKDMGFDDAYSLHEAQFQQVKDEHPDFHGWLMERVGEIEAQG